MKRTLLFLLLLLIGSSKLRSQEELTLNDCVKYAIENNRTLQKSKVDQEKSIESQRELLGALLPQINGSGAISYNFDKNTVVMPNFMNSMLPPNLQDPNADKYMTVPMGMNNAANIGGSLVQQVVNFSLFNALKISKTAQSMADISVDISTEDVISQTATFYYNVQVLEYGLKQFDRSSALMDSTLKIMTANKDNGTIRQVDFDRIKVARTNLISQKIGFNQAVSVQKNLLKLTMGYDVNNDIPITSLDISSLERLIYPFNLDIFQPKDLPTLKLMNQRMKMSELQIRSAKFELLPSLTFVGNYSYYFMGDDFYTGPTFHKYPMSMVSLSLKIPIFTGFTTDAKIKKAKMDLSKTVYDQAQLEQSLHMAHSNAVMQLESNKKTIEFQKDNMKLAEDVYAITERNFNIGISSLSDVLNASSELIKAQISYVEALHNYVQSYIDLKKNDGTIREILN
ncbi:MAG: TolC family protein [Paludibacter sp.]|nr:TolC family protein [Paludibacter sp.]